MKRIILTVKTNPDVLETIQKEVYPVLLYCLKPDGYDAIDDALDIIAIFLYYSRKGLVNELMWKIYPFLLYIVGNVYDQEEKKEDLELGYGY